jgi:hypothetical protein
MHFKPERWLNDPSASKSRFLIPVSIGHRMCVYWAEFCNKEYFEDCYYTCLMFDIEPVQARKDGGTGEMEGTFLCRVKGRGGVELFDCVL